MIPLSAPSLTDLERQYLMEAYDSGWISGMGGSFIHRFEEALADRVGRNHCIAVSNGTAALALALQALNIGSTSAEFGGSPEDEVIVPALTFVSPAAMVKFVGATPVFADIAERSWTISTVQTGRKITPCTRAIIAVDVLGHPCDYENLRIAAGDIPIIEDAAQAHGAEYEFTGKPAGSLGLISTFSFHVNKAVTTGEGGAVLTDDDGLADQMRLIANHGMRPGKGYYHEVVGNNYRMTNLTAAMGLAQVERWHELTQKRQQIAEAYDRRLRWYFEDGALTRRPVAPWAKESCWLYCLHHPERDRIVAHLRDCGIDARAIYTPLPDLPIYADSRRGGYPNACHVGAGAFFLPTSAVMTSPDVEFICERLKEAIR